MKVTPSKAAMDLILGLGLPALVCFLIMFFVSALVVNGVLDKIAMGIAGAIMIIPLAIWGAFRMVAMDDAFVLALNRITEADDSEILRDLKAGEAHRVDLWTEYESRRIHQYNIRRYQQRNQIEMSPLNLSPTTWEEHFASNSRVEIYKVCDDGSISTGNGRTIRANRRPHPRQE